jgi:hypothetical protein
MSLILSPCQIGVVVGVGNICLIPTRARRKETRASPWLPSWSMATAIRFASAILADIISEGIPCRFVNVKQQLCRRGVSEVRSIEAKRLSGEAPKPSCTVPCTCSGLLRPDSLASLIPFQNRRSAVELFFKKELHNERGSSDSMHN